MKSTLVLRLLFAYLRAGSFRSPLKATSSSAFEEHKGVSINTLRFVMSPLAAAACNETFCFFGLWWLGFLRRVESTLDASLTCRMDRTCSACTLSACSACLAPASPSKNVVLQGLAQFWFVSFDVGALKRRTKKTNITTDASLGWSMKSRAGTPSA